MLFLRHCPSCGRPGRVPCPACAAVLVPAPVFLTIPHATSAAAVYSYEAEVRDVILRLKYANVRDGLAVFSRAIADTVQRGGCDIVTWLPTTPARRAARGYDQAELVARAVARNVGLPVRRLLARLDRDPQTGRGAADRARGPRVRALRRLDGRRVLLVDDVITTGASLAAAAAALRAAGAGQVHVRALAATPRRSAPELIR